MTETQNAQGGNALDAAQEQALPEWYQVIESQLLAWAVSGVSDVQMKSDDVVWVVQKDRHVRTNVMYTKQHILGLADMWHPYNPNINQEAGSRILTGGASGNLEVMHQLGDWRCRVVFRREETGIGVTMRFIPPDPPDLASNPLPESVLKLLDINNGLVIVSGPTGSGKTTLLATLLREYNATHARHIYTIEDPIEFVHKPIQSLITQREVGRDVDSFATGIQTAVRSKAQVILVGELRELAAVRAALDAANKGHLVFATAHASSAAQCVQQLVSEFPPDEQNLIRNRLAEVFKCVMVQRLVPSTNDGKLIPIREMMLDHTTTTPKIRDGQFNELTNALKAVNGGMFSFEDSLLEAYFAGQITEETAYAWANIRDNLTPKIDRFKREQALAAQQAQNAAGQAG